MTPKWTDQKRLAEAIHHYVNTTGTRSQAERDHEEEVIRKALNLPRRTQ